MELNGYLQNGVIVLTDGVSLPESTPVTVTCGVDAITPPPQQRGKKRVQLPLVRSATPGTLHLTNAMIGEIFDEEEAAAGLLVEEPVYDDSPWTDEERDEMRAEALDHLGWEGMEVYQVDAQATGNGSRP